MFGFLSSSHRENHRAGYQQIEKRKGQHCLPSPGHKLIEAGAWERRPKKNEQANEKECLEPEPDRSGEDGPQPAAKVKQGYGGGDQYHADILTHEKHSELHSGILRMKPGNQLALRFGEIEG